MELKFLWSSNPQVPPITPCSSLSPFPATVLATQHFPTALQPTGRSSRAPPQPGLGLHVHRHMCTPPLTQEMCHIRPPPAHDPHGSTVWPKILMRPSYLHHVTIKLGPAHRYEKKKFESLPKQALNTRCLHLHWRCASFVAQFNVGSWTICSVTISKPITLVHKKKFCRNTHEI